MPPITMWHDARRMPGFRILKVAIPAAMPLVFVGLFMGLGGYLRCSSWQR